MRDTATKKATRQPGDTKAGDTATKKATRQPGDTKAGDTATRQPGTPNQATRQPGHRRYYAARELGLDEVPTYMLNFGGDELREQECLLLCNKQRSKTNEQVLRECTKLTEIKTEQQRLKQLETLKQGEKIPDRENFPQRETGKARDLAAKEFGLSGKTAQAGAKVVARIDALQAQGQADEAAKLRDTLNHKSVNAAYLAIKEPKEPQEPKEHELTYDELLEENEYLSGLVQELKEENARLQSLVMKYNKYNKKKLNKLFP